MNPLRELWADETGAVVSAELVLVGTLGVIGATVGLNTVSTALNDELLDVAFALRSLDQSYSVPEHSACGVWTAGSCYRQQDVSISLEELRSSANREEGSPRDRSIEAPVNENDRNSAQVDDPARFPNMPASNGRHSTL